MIFSAEYFHVEITDRIIALVVDHVEQRSNFGERVGHILQKFLHLCQFFIIGNLALKQYHQFAGRRSTYHHVTQHAFLSTQVEEWIVVGICVVTDTVPDAVGDIILKPALLNCQHLVESSGNMESYGIHLIVFHILFHFFLGQPSLVREGIFQLIAVEHGFFRT